MQVTISPNYNDIFDGPTPEIADLLNGIPSVAILHLMGLLNAELFTGRPGKDLQLRLLGLMTMRLPKDISFAILRKAQRRVDVNNGEEVAFFSTLYNLEFIHYELTNFREGEFDVISPAQDLSILKAYFLIIGRINNIYARSLTPGLKLDQQYFYKMIWPTLLEQFELNQKTNTFTAMVKGLAFFNQIEFQTKYTETVKEFMHQAGQQNATAYLGLLVSSPFIFKFNNKIRQ